MKKIILVLLTLSSVAAYANTPKCKGKMSDGTPFAFGVTTSKESGEYSYLKIGNSQYLGSEKDSRFFGSSTSDQVGVMTLKNMKDARKLVHVTLTSDGTDWAIYVNVGSEKNPTNTGTAICMDYYY